MLVSLLAAIALGFGDGLPGKHPAAVGMSAKRLAAIDRVVGRGIRAGGFPGASVIVGRRGAAVFSKGYGRLGWTKDASRVDPDASIYDLASLTKVVGTTTAIMILYDEGRIALDARVVEYLPAFTGGWKDSITIRQLLTHRSGLPASRDLWKLATNPQEARLGVIDAVLQCRPGVCFDYSDLGMVLLGMVVENVSGVGLDRFLADRVFGPLGMTSTFFRPAESFRSRIAPTDVTPPRGYPLRGEVADENAYALGGVAGHAGIFSTASDIAVFAQMMLNGGEYNGVRIIADSTIALFTRRAAGTRALGWDTADGDGGSGSYLSGTSYGHTGYTGTSLWIDPDRELFVVLLTNRVHAARATPGEGDLGRASRRVGPRRAFGDRRSAARAGDATLLPRRQGVGVESPGARAAVALVETPARCAPRVDEESGERAEAGREARRFGRKAPRVSRSFVP